jgi:hypothetical protein
LLTLSSIVNQCKPLHEGSKYNDKPMTGWTTVMVALQMCDSVSLYGFQAGPFGHSTVPA